MTMRFSVATIKNISGISIPTEIRKIMEIAEITIKKALIILFAAIILER